MSKLVLASFAAGTVLALLWLAIAIAHARESRSFDYWGNLSTPAEARRHDLRRFHCVVQMELAQREIMRGRWNPKC